MLDILSPENLKNTAAHILHSNMQNFWEFRALAQQIIYEAMKSPEEAATLSESSVALISAISGADAHVVGATKPLGGSRGPGKAFRFALLQECLEVFEEAMAHVDHVRFLPTDHPDYLQASKRVWAFGYVLCAFVNWKLLRDTALNVCLEQLLRFSSYLEDVPMVCVELAASILQSVDPWMDDNWGYTSNRYLDSYYFRIQHWCWRQIFLSKMPEGCFVDIPFCYDILDKVISPRMQWINQKREEMAYALDLPAVDVDALEATGRDRVPSMQMDPTPTPPLQPQPHQPVQELSKTERVNSGGEGPSFFAFPLLSVDPASAAAPVPGASYPAPVINTFDDVTATAAVPAPATAAAPAPARGAAPSLTPAAAPAPAPRAAPSSTPAAAPAPRAAPSSSPSPAPSPAPAAAPASNTAAVPTAAPAPATAAGPARTTTAATVPTADHCSIAATAGVVDSASDPQIIETPADIPMSSDSASSRSADSVYAPRSRASSDRSGTSPSSSGDASNSPDSRSSTEDHATSSDSRSNTGDAANSPDSRRSNQSTKARPHAQHMHTHGVNDRASYRLPMSTHKERPGSVGHSAHSSQSVPARGYGHTHAHTDVQQVPIRNSNAQLDTMSSNHPTAARASEPHCLSEGKPAEDCANLSEAVSRALQEYMLSHDSSEFVDSLQVLLCYGDAAAVLQTLLQSAIAKLEQLSKPKPSSKFTPLPRSRKALQRHFEEQRDRMFCKGGVIDPLAFDFNQYGEAKGRRSGLGFQIPPSNPGYKLMTRWGWQEGRGLGANLQGRTEPCLPAYQPLDRDNAKQGLGELRYKGMLQGDAAADQLRGLLVEICSGESAVLGGEAVQQGIRAFLTNSTPHATPNAPPLRIRTLCWVGSVLGALVYKGSLAEEQASDLVSSAARASLGPGGSNTLQRLTKNMWAAVSKQRSACRQAEEQADEAKRKEAEQLAELHQPRAPTKKTTYVQGPEGKALKIRIKQYGGSSSAAPSSDGRVSWE